jgi:cAMP phosphodiesterase
VGYVARKNSASSSVTLILSMMANKLYGLKVQSYKEQHIAQIGKLLHLKMQNQKTLSGLRVVVEMLKPEPIARQMANLLLQEVRLT